MESELNETSDFEVELSTEDSFEIEPDLPPKYCHYRDEGCELADSCLNCPFLQCIYEEAGGMQHWMKKMQNKEIARLFSKEGKGVKELASKFSLSQRTIQRALRDSVLSLPSLSYQVRGKHNFPERSSCPAISSPHLEKAGNSHGREEIK